ncbi:MAG: diguanylate cyclase [Proteobacteria bacterium]|nr:diguanylate cyclase [Pseudomonadota bacterium]
MSTSEPPSPAASFDPFRALLDEVGAFVYTTDRQGRYTYANRLVLELLGGHALEYVLGKDISHFFGEAGNAALRETDRRVLEDGETLVREETNLIAATGELRSYWSTKKPLRDATGAIVGLLGISHDITEKKRLEDTVREQNAMLDAILENVDALVYVKGADRRFRYANQRTASAFGLPVERIVGALDSELMPVDAADRFWEKDRRILATGERWAGEETLFDATGKMHHYWSVVAPLLTPNGRPAVVGLSTDITELHELKEELRRQATTDGLTGIANRRSFLAQAEREFARSRRHGTALSLIAIDIDHFKRINDELGHPTGDRVLREFAAAVAATLRSVDLFARTGGEEFCILLPDTDGEQATVTAQRVRELAHSVVVDPVQADWCLHLSAGVASLRAGDDGFEQLFARADRALYAAKRQGRDRVNRSGDDENASSAR